jgi:aspartyl protease family protein
MLMRHILAVFAGAFVTVWLILTWQERRERAAEPVFQVQADAEAMPDEFDEDAELLAEGDGTVLTRQPDGHFYTMANVNGGDVRFLVDTGASAIALTGADADALGISWDENELEKIGRGVSGDVYGKAVMLKSVQVGDIIVHDVQAAVIPAGLDVSLLGQSFLSKIGSVNIQEDQMTFNSGA